MIENNIIFYLNEKKVKIRVKPSETVLNILHKLGYLGAKESCNEGDCGSCTIAINNLGKIGEYKAITSCIIPATKMHKRHVITIEGLGTPVDTHPIQQIIFDNHATQCGFCTPGIIMSLFSKLTEKKIVTSESLKKSLEGNLCRCTGYQHIIEASEEILENVNNATLNSDNILPSFCKNIQRKLNEIPDKIEQIENPIDDVINIQSYTLLYSIDELKEKIQKLNSKNYKIISGASDLFVEKNIQKKYYSHYFDVSRIPEMLGIKLIGETIEIGASEPIEKIIGSDIIKTHISSLNKAIFWMSSRQIRNVATLAGNIGNASPIGDASSALVGLDASLLLISPKAERIVKLENYFQGYKSTILAEDEFIAKIIIPIQKENRFYNFIKTSKRKNMDISTVNSFCSMKVDSKGKIIDIRLVYGGVSVFPQLAKNAIAEIKNHNIYNLDYDRIEVLLKKDFMPISDVRASNEYRNLLIRNHLIKHIATYKMEFNNEK